ncbi:hypothetical protein [Mycoavidus sp. HKI]|uniref:hypothetical protein n=1 Tax=Mycoavidus sp. HKI TaxID=2840467 RepID=UPI001CBF9BD4
MLFAQHEIEYAPSLNRADIKRKAEFFAGRYAAHQAIKRLGTVVMMATTTDKNDAPDRCRFLPSILSY